MFKVAEISWYATTQQLLQGWLGLNWLIELSRLLLRSKFHYKPQMSGVTALKITRDSSSCWKPLSDVMKNVWQCLKKQKASLLHVCPCVYYMYVQCTYICILCLYVKYLVDATHERQTEGVYGLSQPVFKMILFTYLLYTILRSLHSKKLHILGFLASMVCTRSLEIFFLSLSDRGTYHFCNRSFPCRLNNSMNCIWGRKFSFKFSTVQMI